MRYLFLISLLFSASLFAFQLNPTPPDLADDSHNEPTPDFSSCSIEFNVCGYQSYTDTFDQDYIWQACGDPYFYEYFSITAGDPLGCLAEEVPGVPTNCHTCSCPSGQIRDGHQCVIDQSCGHGIRNYQTGECYPSTCPYGDGTDANCGRVAACVPSEGTVLQQILSEPPTCECIGGEVWNPSQEQCVEPLCNGTEGSPVASIFSPNTQSCVCPITHALNTDTNTCVQFSCEEPIEIFVGSTGQCEVPPDCSATQDLDAYNNVCISNEQVDESQCDLIDHNLGWALSIKLDNQCYSPALVAYQVSGGDMSGFSFWDWCSETMVNGWSHAQDVHLDQENAKKQCNQCLNAGNYPTLINRTFSGAGLILDFNICFTPEAFCISRQGTWNDYHDVCMNPENEAYEVPVRSSSSSSSLASSSSLSSSVSSGGTGGGGQNSSGTGGGDGGDGGSGGSGGSAASASSAAASSAAASAASVAASASSQNNSAGNSANNSAGNSANNSEASEGGGGGQNSSGSGGGGASGSNTSSGGGGGGGGSAGNSSAGGGNSSASNSSAGECDPQASDYLDCIGGDKKPFSPHTVAGSGATTFGEANQLFFDAIEGSPIVQSFNNVANMVDASNAECLPFEIDLSDVIGAVLSTNIMCEVFEVIRPILSALMLAFFSFVAFRVFASS